MPQRPPWPVAAASPLVFFALHGCASPMNTVDPAGNADDRSSTFNRVEDGPFRFRSHNLGVYCFGTWGCRATRGEHVVWNDPFDVWNPPKTEFPAGLRDRMRGNQGPFKNSDGPLVVEWLDEQRVHRRTVIDLPSLLAEGVIPHGVPLDQIRPGVTVPPPDLIVEVEGTTLRLYLVSYIPLRQPRDPSRASSSRVTEWVLIHEERDVERVR